LKYDGVGRARFTPGGIHRKRALTIFVENETGQSHFCALLLNPCAPDAAALAIPAALSARASKNRSLFF
jgi:hypothetical protein